MYLAKYRGPLFHPTGPARRHVPRFLPIGPARRHISGLGAGIPRNLIALELLEHGVPMAMGDVCTVLTTGARVCGPSLAKVPIPPVAHPIVTYAPTVYGSTALTSDPQCVAAGMVGGPYPNCIALSAASSIVWTDPSTYPWYLWAAIAAGGYFLFVRGR